MIAVTYDGTEVAYFDNTDEGKQKLTMFLAEMYRAYVDKDKDSKELDNFYATEIQAAALETDIDIAMLKNEVVGAFA